MIVYRGYKEAAAKSGPCVFAMGNFDGVHLGHVSLLKRARELAVTLDAGVGLYTFWPHPQLVLNRHADLKLICTREQKLKLFEQHGVDIVIEEPFTLEFASVSAEDFAVNIIAATLNAKGVVTGENFRFGHNATGTSRKLHDWLKPFGIIQETMTAISVGNELCSSSRIRHLVAKGLVCEAAAMLGRPFSIVGSVVEGAGRGKTIGIPTANLSTKSMLLPNSGVYQCLVRIADRDELVRAATNIGTRPTFSGSNEVHVESHLLEFSENIYGETMEVFFIKKIRDERKFFSAEELVSQIRKDIETVREY